ncbi:MULTISPECIES: MarR family transcriptional regulator [unclassified Rhizobium]|uniref:MarR family winged helix-turn-helix transcriptional regulator n=1 Tax=unclassified Rhizobium TaxID=2613769 RepID=UPI00185E27DF|nr:MULTISPECIES: MarR family transcriptional regulator [unclassified Rhizobium]MBB3543827.1 DNA-binding MarR family transcriptional regulator [Rhizobium sp. BK399]MCS3742144.1 DNA-binding MarR family transcriptional regulator [Rhizobium sp. BK661]
MRMISNAVSHGFARRLAVEDVTVAEWVLMRSLYDEGPISPSVLAEKMHMTKGTVSKLADRLATKAFIDRIGNDRDRRAHSLVLTVAGREKVPRLAALADQNDAEYFDVLTGQERVALDEILKSLVQRRGLKTVPVK